MNVKLILKLLAITLAAGLVASCNNAQKTSRATGWDLTGKNGGPSYVVDYKGQETGPGLVFVPGGTFTMGKVADDPMSDWNNVPTQQTVASFYMDESEVTNRMYLQYLDWLRYTFPPSKEEYSQILKGALPDTLVWRSPLGNFKTLVYNYLRHPAYQNYPVVGVSWIQATEFSQWRTDRVNELRLLEKGYLKEGALWQHEEGTQFSTETYLAAPKKVYGEGDSLTQGKNSKRLYTVIFGDTTHKNVMRKDGIILPAYRLPTEAEWEYAAMGLSSNRQYNNYRGRKKFPWEGQYTISRQRNKQGDQLANFKHGYGDYAGVAGWSSDGANITNEVMSYPPNDFGLYDMAGNVAEWVADVYRPRINMDLSDFNYYRGNVYMKNVINKDGSVNVLGADEVQYDTLRNGRIVARSLPGSLAKEPISEDQTYLRMNYSRSDNRAYADGDKMSSRYYYKQGPLTEAQRMYNSPQPEVTLATDSTGSSELNKQMDTGNRTTLISKTSRVVKGGSWKDYAYWLDPAQRRYFPQDMATNWIGFRCAMSRVGSSFKKGRSAD